MTDHKELLDAHELLKGQGIPMPPGLSGEYPPVPELHKSGADAPRPAPAPARARVVAAAVVDVADDSDESDLPKMKELDRINVPPFPNITTIQSWQTALLQNVVTASGKRVVRPLIHWLTKVWLEKPTYEELASSESKAYITLDLKLATGLQLMIQQGGAPAKELKDTVARKMEEGIKQGHLITGRQIIRLLMQSYKTFDNSEIVYGFDHLAKLECGKDLYAFITQWNKVLENMNGRLDDVMLKEVFYRKICDNKDLSADINVYNRLGDAHPDRSYKWLMNVVMQEITLKRERRNMADRESTIATILSGDPSGRGRNAAATPEGGAGGEATVANPKAKGAATKTSAQQEADKKSAALQKKVADSEKEIKKLTETLAAATLHPKGGGKGAEKGKGKTKAETPCFYFHVDNLCRRTESDCYFSHKPISKAIKATLVRPEARAPSRPSSPSPDGKGKGKGKKAVINENSYCFEFNANGACSKDNCIFLILLRTKLQNVKSGSWRSRIKNNLL
jgi:hypothetical protein